MEEKIHYYQTNHLLQDKLKEWYESNDKSLNFESQNNYFHVEPNSYFFTDLNHILETLKYPRTNEYKTEEEFINHLRIGLENTIKNGYQITKTEK